MKPRLDSESLTDEDRAAWFDWQVNRWRDWNLWGHLARISWPSDRRDADLMVLLLESKRCAQGTVFQSVWYVPFAYPTEHY